MAVSKIVRSENSFDLTVDGHRAGYLSYAIEDGALLIEYVEVDRGRRGQGWGEKLVDAAVAFAEAHGHKVVPICGYAKTVLKRRQK